MIFLNSFIYGKKLTFYTIMTSFYHVMKILINFDCLDLFWIIYGTYGG